MAAVYRTTIPGALVQTPWPTHDLDVARRAGALCIAREPHRAPGEDWPCHRCMTRVRNSSAPALAGVTDGPASIVAPGTGVSGRVPAWSPNPSQDGDSTSANSNRPPAVNEGPAEGAAATARTEGYR